jgi:2-polyprenyl-3-methyl-5-hydroxy-6-metoxy-1,4-benzoquinol methylase
MQQTPVHEHHNNELLSIIPKTSRKIIEIGCSSGALAREFKKENRDCFWFGMEIEPSYAELAARHCDQILVGDIEHCDEKFFLSQADKDCVLEHLKDPWKVLNRIRKVIPPNGSIVACIPNAQHWSLIARLALGDFRYEDSGLLDRTHLRWFTRKTVIELFNSQGFRIQKGLPRVLNAAPDKDVVNFAMTLARKFGADPETTKNDTLIFQHVIRAIPR